MKLRDRFWQWGHTEGRYNHCYGIEEESRMTPMEGCLYFGVPNTFMVPVAEEVNKRQYNKSFKTLKEVVWECYAADRNPAAVDEFIEDAREFTNITGIVFDDFGVDPERDKDLQQYLDPFDGFTMWLRTESDIPKLKEKFEILKKMTQGKRRLFGCYLYNHRTKSQASAAGVVAQLDWYREKIYAGEAEGVVLHTNAWADLDYEASEAAAKWMEQHGDEEI